MFKGLTFDNQNVTSKNDGGLYDRLFFKDGILRGCSMSVNNTSLTVQPGLLVIGGRLVWVDSATSVTFDNPVTNGYGRVILTIDLSQPALSDEFAQMRTSVDYSATTTFPALKQEDINGEGGALIYQAALAVVSIANGNLSKISSAIGNTAINADLFGANAPNYYAKQSELTDLSNTAALKNQLLDVRGRGYSNNANSISDGVTVCNVNIPSGSSAYRAVWQVTISGNEKVQFALPEEGSTTSNYPLAWRWYWKTGWSPWQTDILSTDFEYIWPKGQRNDANNIKDGITMCTTNIPAGSAGYRAVLQATVSNNNIVQLAMPYEGSNTSRRPLAWRWMWNSVWGPWQENILSTDFENIISKGTTNNANSINDGITWCRTNIPSGLGHAFVLQCSYDPSEKVQFAMPFSSASSELPIFWRWYHTASGWAPWIKALYVLSDGSTCTLGKVNFSSGAYLWGYSDGSFGWRAKALNISQLNGSAGTPVTAGTYTTVSTRKTKTAIEDLDLERAKKLLDIRPVEFEIRDDTGHKKHYGMIAEEVEDVDDVPVTHDDTGEIIGLDYQGFIAPLIRLAQEQERRINELEKKIDEMSQKK